MEGFAYHGLKQSSLLKEYYAWRLEVQKGWFHAEESGLHIYYCRVWGLSSCFIFYIQFFLRTYNEVDLRSVYGIYDKATDKMSVHVPIAIADKYI